jgi:hypothetical protein
MPAVGLLSEHINAINNIHIMESKLYDGTKVVVKLNKQKTSHQLDHYIQVANKLLENIFGTTVSNTICIHKNF